ncbi:MAG: DUF433 domain-containing protein [Ignavibacteriae bacterium]|nr:DUF433 domain-containing protein [Ignavibacteriota bacterium]
MNKRITSSPEICGGEPSIAGTRIPVSVILSYLAAGETYDHILKQFPHLTKEDILAALEYAAYLSTEKALPAE